MAVATTQGVGLELAFDESGYIPVPIRAMDYDGCCTLHVWPRGPLPGPPITARTVRCLVRVTFATIPRGTAIGTLFWETALQSASGAVTIVLEDPFRPEGL